MKYGVILDCSNQSLCSLWRGVIKFAMQSGFNSKMSKRIKRLLDYDGIRTNDEYDYFVALCDESVSYLNRNKKNINDLYYIEDNSLFLVDTTNKIKYYTKAQVKDRARNTK